MRLFIAFTLPQELLKKIKFLEEKIEEKIRFKIRWIPLKKLHLTILFLGHLNYEDYLKIENIFDNFKLSHQEIIVKIKKIDYGPPGFKRMIWLYLEKNEKLEEIKKYFEEEIEKRGIKYKKEARDYLPHINLIRLKEEKLPEIKEELNLTLNLKEICLFESFLKKEGAEYKKLKCVKINK